MTGGFETGLFLRRVKVNPAVIVHGKILIICLLIAACGGPTGPSRDELVASISSRLPAELTVYELVHENLPGQIEGSGRSSIVGTLELRTDLYAEANESVVTSVKQQFADIQLQTIFFDALGWGRKFWSIATPKGTKVPFRANLQFQKEVDGWNISGSPAYEAPNGVSQFHESGVIIGSANFDALFNSALARVKDEEQARNRLLGSVEAFFEEGKFVVKKDNGERWFSFERTGEMDVRANQRSGYISGPAYISNVSMTVTVAWEKRMRYGNQRTYDVGEVTEGLVHGDLVHRDNNWYIANLQIAMNDSRDKKGGFSRSSYSFLFADGVVRSKSRYPSLVIVREAPSRESGGTPSATPARAKLEAEYSNFAQQAEQRGMGDFAANLFLYDGITMDRIDIVEFALEKGADVNIGVDDEAGPFAFHATSVPMLEFLFQNGASVTLSSPFGWGGNWLTAAITAHGTGHSLEVIEFLLAKGVSVTAKDADGNTPLALARERQKSLAREVEAERAKSKSEHLPEMEAELERRNSVIGLLLKYGAKY